MQTLNATVEYCPLGNSALEMVNQLRNGSIDLAVATYTATERRRQEFELSEPLYNVC